MIKLVFNNLEESEFAKMAAIERIQNVIDRFPALEHGNIVVTLSMQNSPTQAGPDVFTVKFVCQSGSYKGVILKKSAANLYSALADLSNHLLERLNRYSDKHRVKKIKNGRNSKNLGELGVDS